MSSHVVDDDPYAGPLTSASAHAPGTEPWRAAIAAIAAAGAGPVAADGSEPAADSGSAPVESARAARPLRWGVLGPGRIAAMIAPDFAQVHDGVIAAVGSRSLARAQAFAAEFGSEDAPIRAHGSYADLLADPDVDAIYIATPHAFHLAQARAAIRAGKPVLVEKSFAATLDGAEQIVAAARAHGVFAMEAMWTRFLPAVTAARALAFGGAIGEVRGVQADLCVYRPYDPTDRLFDLNLGGGTVLDLGVYVVSFAQMILGTPDGVVAHGSLLPTGADAECAYLLRYDDGRAATLMSSFNALAPGGARIMGSLGWIDVPPRFHHPTGVVLELFGQEPERFELPPAGRGYHYQFDEVAARLRAGKLESEIMPLADTLAVQAVMQQANDQLGVAAFDASDSDAGIE